MAIFAMADLHLAISNPEKSMEVFGNRWGDYIPKIRAAFGEKVCAEDTVLMPGDLSWATYLSEAREDFEFIDSLPGRKLICRGNHDYWWTTVAKMEKTFAEMGITTIDMIRHNCIEVEETLITGTRGWKLPTDDSFSAEDRKIYDREKIRIGLCIDALKKQDPEHSRRWLLMLHYPPLTTLVPETDLSKLIEEAGVDVCIYGHLHGRAHKRAFEGEKTGTLYRCVAADYLGFSPVQV